MGGGARWLLDGNADEAEHKHDEGEGSAGLGQERYQQVTADVAAAACCCLRRRRVLLLLLLLLLFIQTRATTRWDRGAGARWGSVSVVGAACRD